MSDCSLYLLVSIFIRRPGRNLLLRFETFRTQSDSQADETSVLGPHRLVWQRPSILWSNHTKWHLAAEKLRITHAASIPLSAWLCPVSCVCHGGKPSNTGCTCYTMSAAAVECGGGDARVDFLVLQGGFTQAALCVGIF